MENASKALAIAGGILLALLVLWSLIYMVQNAGELKKQEISEERQKQILEFNKEFESFDKKLMRGTDVITVMNMANNYNSKNAWDMNKNSGKGGWDEELKVEAIVMLKTKITVKKEHIKSKINNKKIIDLYQNEYHFKKFPTESDGDIIMKANKTGGYIADSKEYIAIMLDDEENDAHSTDFALKEFKRRFFKCKGITYNSLTGLIQTITFEEIKMDVIPGY